MAKTDDLPDFRTGQVITEKDLNAIVSAIRILRGRPVQFAVVALLVAVLSWQIDGTSAGILILAEIFSGILRLISRNDFGDFLSIVLVTLGFTAIAWLIAPRGK